MRKGVNLEESINRFFVIIRTNREEGLKKTKSEQRKGKKLNK